MQEKTDQSRNVPTTDTQQTIADLRRQMADLGWVFDNMEDLVVALDNSDRVIMANGPFRKLFRRLNGHDLQIGDEVAAFLTTDQATYCCETIAKVQAGSCTHFDHRYDLGNQRYDVEWSAGQVLAKDGSRIGVAFIGREITSRRVAEETLRQKEAQLHHAQKLEAVGTLARGVAHEFNNALSIVLGNLELASMDIYADLPVRPYVDDAKAGLLRAKQMVRQLLDFSKKSDGRQQLVDVHVVAANALSLLRASIPTHIEFHHLINTCPPVMADPSHIHQLIVNLCSNSAAAMDLDGGVLTVTLDRVALRPGKIPEGTRLAVGNYVKLTVADTRQGDEDDQGEQTGPPSVNAGHERGTGMGLAVAQGIVKSYAGEMVMTHVLDRGMKWEVYLPAATPEKDDEAPIPDLSDLKGTERILFVDDEPQFVMITQRQLEHLGYHVEIFTSAIAALERFTQGPDDFDLVISDVAMPKLTGDKLINQIRLIRPTIPAILCTGYSEKVDRKSATLLGCEYVIKPVERDRLAQVIRTTLDKFASGSPQA